MIDQFRKLLALLTPPERRQFYLLVLLMLVVGHVRDRRRRLDPAVHGGAVRPGPHREPRRPRPALRRAGLHRHPGFMVFLGVATFGWWCSASSRRSCRSMRSPASRACAATCCRAGCCSAYLRQPYTWFLNRHTADLGKAVLSEVDSVVYQSFIPGMKLISNVFVSVVHRRPADRAAADGGDRHRGAALGELRADLRRGAPADHPLRHDALRGQRRALPHRPGGDRRHQGRQAPGARGRLHPPLPGPGAPGGARRRGADDARRGAALPAAGHRLRRHAARHPRAARRRERVARRRCCRSSASTPSPGCGSCRRCSRSTPRSPRCASTARRSRRCTAISPRPRRRWPWRRWPAARRSTSATGSTSSTCITATRSPSARRCAGSRSRSRRARPSASSAAPAPARPPRST